MAVTASVIAAQAWPEEEERKASGFSVEPQDSVVVGRGRTTLRFKTCTIRWDTAFATVMASPSCRVPGMIRRRSLTNAVAAKPPRWVVERRVRSSQRGA